MNNSRLILISIIIISYAIVGFIALDGRNPGSRPDAYNNPPVVFGPSLDTISPVFIQQSFEDTLFPPPGWIKYNPDAGSGWTRVTAGTSPLPGWNGGTITTPPGGGIGSAYCTWSTGGPVSNDQWLVTPQILSVGFEDSLVFWVQCSGYANAQYGDSLLIMISTTTPAIQSFSRAAVLSWTAGSADTLWTRKSFKLTDFPGVSVGSSIYVAFREIAHNNSQFGAAILLDLITVIQQPITGLQYSTANIPEKFGLKQNYPNPFNPTTKINFDLPEKSFVSLKVFDLLGREVSNLVNKELKQGSYSVDFDGSKLNSGMYFYTLKTENASLTRKMMLVK